MLMIEMNTVLTERVFYFYNVSLSNTGIEVTNEGCNRLLWITQLDRGIRGIRPKHGN